MSDKKVDPKIFELLDDLATYRKKLISYSEQLEVVKDDVVSIFPKKLDYKDRFFLEDKIKTMSSFYSSILNIRQEVNKMIVQEIEIRRRLEQDDDEAGQSINIRKIAESLNKKGFKISKELKDIVDLKSQQILPETTKDVIVEPSITIGDPTNGRE